MSLVSFKARNHLQQVRKRGARDDVDDRGTDPILFSQLNQRFAFTVDVAAAAHNAKCSRFYDLEKNGLLQTWANERVWCNPPYSNIRPWVEKAIAETEAELIVMLLPANRTEQSWWQELIEPNRDNGGRLRVEFMKGRLRFVQAGKQEIGPNERPPFGCCLLVWGAAGDRGRRVCECGGHIRSETRCVRCAAE